MAVKEQLGDLGCSSVVEHLFARKDKSILWKEVALCSVTYGELTCVCAPYPKTSFPFLLERPLTLLQGARSALTDGHQADTEAHGGFRMSIIWCPSMSLGS